MDVGFAQQTPSDAKLPKSNNHSVGFKQKLVNKIKSWNSGEQKLVQNTDCGTSKVILEMQQ